MKITQEIVQEFLNYDPETGILTWKERDAKWFKADGKNGAYSAAKTWNTRYAHKQLLSKHKSGYYTARIFDKSYLTHRLAWIWMTGEWPEEVDHINGVPNDNRWVNLRSVDHKTNNQNAKKYSNNTSGTPGVYWHKSANKWFVRIIVNQKRIYLGLFSSLEEAIKVRKAAEMKYGFHKNHGRDEISNAN